MGWRRDWGSRDRGGWFGPTPMVPPVGGPLTKEEEIEMLEEQARLIESQLNAARKRLEQLRKSPLTPQPQPYYQAPPYSYPPMPYYTQSPEEELASLEDYRKYLDEEVKGAEARIEELKKLLKKQ